MLPARRPFPLRSLALVWIAGFILLLGACAPPSPTELAWLPDARGWSVRDVDEADPPQWVLYERDARIADVKELRIVGLVDAPPEIAAAALRHRLLADEYVPKGLDRRILRASPSAVVIYGRTSLPFPFRDREATEHFRFEHDPGSGAYRVHARTIDPGSEPPRGVVRVPLIRNVWALTPHGPSRSVFITDTVHDVGSPALNRVIERPIATQLVEDLQTLNALTGSMQATPGHSTAARRATGPRSGRP